MVTQARSAQRGDRHSERSDEVVYGSERGEVDEKEEGERVLTEEEGFFSLKETRGPCTIFSFASLQLIAASGCHSQRLDCSTVRLRP